MDSRAKRSVDTANALSAKTIFLHWIVAAFIIVNLMLGFYIHRTETYSLMGLHKSIGVVAICFIFWRFIWRMRAGWLDDSLGNSTNIELRLARIVHWLLIICALIAPISGIIGSIASGRGLPFFSFELIAPNIDEWGSGQREALNEDLAKVSMTVHAITVKLMALCLILHVVGTLKHALIYKDRIVGRMFGRTIS